MDTATVERIREAVEKERVRNAPPAEFPDLPRIPRERYVDPDFFQLELEHVFGKSWLYAGSGWELPSPGDFKIFDNMGRAPILLLRGEDNIVRAFYNTCQHRGAQVVTKNCGNTGKLLRCQFHSWSYDLTGKLVAVTAPWDFSTDMDKGRFGLKAVRCEMWGSYIFVNLSKDAPDLFTWLGPVAKDFDWAANLRPSNRHERLLGCHWRLAIEAFVEVYHIASVHPRTVFQGIEHRGAISTFFPNGHSRMICPNTPQSRAPALEGPLPAGWDEGRPLRREASVSYNIFPNLLTPASETGFFLMEFWPVDDEHTRLAVTVFDADWGAGDPPSTLSDHANYFDGVMDEDTWNMDHIQHSMRSPAFAGPKVGYHEKRIYNIEEHIDRMIGPEKISERLRVEQLLDRYIVQTADAI
jgi:phenylpropionate dioxygenase-like ring-hydroxylating dioxygenase large terminal subunit